MRISYLYLVVHTCRSHYWPSRGLVLSNTLTYPLLVSIHFIVPFNNPSSLLEVQSTCTASPEGTGEPTDERTDEGSACSGERLCVYMCVWCVLNS